MAAKRSATGVVFPTQPTMFQPGYSLVVTVDASSCARVTPGIDPAQTTSATRIAATRARADEASTQTPAGRVSPQPSPPSDSNPWYRTPVSPSDMAHSRRASASSCASADASTRRGALLSRSAALDEVLAACGLGSVAARSVGRAPMSGPWMIVLKMRNATRMCSRSAMWPVRFEAENPGCAASACASTPARSKRRWSSYVNSMFSSFERP